MENLCDKSQLKNVYRSDENYANIKKNSSAQLISCIN